MHPALEAIAGYGVVAAVDVSLRRLGSCFAGAVKVQEVVCEPVVCVCKDTREAIPQWYGSVGLILLVLNSLVLLCLSMSVGEPGSRALMLFEGLRKATVTNPPDGLLRKASAATITK